MITSHREGWERTLRAFTPDEEAGQSWEEGGEWLSLPSLQLGTSMTTVNLLALIPWILTNTQRCEGLQTKQPWASLAKPESSSCFTSSFLMSLWWSVFYLHSARQRAASLLAHARIHTHSDSLTHTDTHSCVQLTATHETLRTGGLALRVLMISHSEVSCSHTHTHMHSSLCVLRTLSGDKRSSLWLWLGSSGSFVCT